MECLLLLLKLRSPTRSEEHTSELQSHDNLVCRLLLEKKKNISKLTAYLHSFCHTHQPPMSPAPAAKDGTTTRHTIFQASGYRLNVHGFFFFFNDPAPPEIYPLPLRHAFPI